MDAISRDRKVFAMIVLLIWVMLLLLAAQAATAAAPEPKLVLSHVCVIDGIDPLTGKSAPFVEFHFVATGLPTEPPASSGVQFWGTLNGTPFGPWPAPYTATTGNASHFTLQYPQSTPPITTTAILTATLVLPDMTLDLSNPQEVPVGPCVPTAVTIKSFTANRAAGLMITQPVQKCRFVKALCTIVKSGGYAIGNCSGLYTFQVPSRRTYDPNYYYEVTGKVCGIPMGSPRPMTEVSIGLKALRVW